MILLYERALRNMPTNYKLWKKYLDFRRLHYNQDPSSQSFRSLCECYERCLLFLHKMPRIWLDYAKFCFEEQKLVTHTRRIYDRALMALPVTQHKRIWDQFLKFALDCGVLETAYKVYERFLHVDTAKIDDYIDFLLEKENWDLATKWMVISMDRDRFTSSRGRTIFELWNKLADVVSEHSEDIVSVNVENVLRAAIRRFSEQTARFWVSLAKYHILRRAFEKARDIYEEALVNVKNLGDFSQVFEAYTEFEESIISILLENDSDDPESQVEIDLRMERLENLVNRRPFLLNHVLLHQNPNDVKEWLNRVKLFEPDSEKMVETFSQAVDSINPKKAYGNLENLWIEFANLFERLAKEENSESPDLSLAEEVFEKALNVQFSHPDSLAEIYIAFSEMELKNGRMEKALSIARSGVSHPESLKRASTTVNYADQGLSAQLRVFKSMKLWGFFLDLEEASGTFESVCAAYDRIMDLKICSAQVVTNYALFLEEHKYFEDSFKVYERGIELFGYPVAFDLWNIYLQKFLDRYGGKKLERARDLFEESLKGCPAKYCKSLYLMYGKMEEDFGLARRALQIYERSLLAVEPSEKLDMYNFCATKASNFFGLTAARPIYENALENLPDLEANIIASHFINLELKLGEIDRVRAIFGYASQFNDPNAEERKIESGEIDKSNGFWERWREFEISYGNEETFKEMLRIKRSVKAMNMLEPSILSSQSFVPASSTDSNNQQEGEEKE